MFEVIVKNTLIEIVSIFLIILWQKKINPKTTWIYAIYLIGLIVFWNFAV